MSKAQFPTPDTSVSVSLSAFLGGSRTARLGLDRRQGNEEVRASLQQSQPAGRGWSYQLEAARQGASTGTPQHAGRALVQYRARFADVGLDIRASGSQQQVDLRASGSVAAIAGDIYVSRPITQGFAVVDVAGLEGVDVSFRHQNFGATDERGRLFIPDLVPYLGNSISVSQRGLPVHVSVVEPDRRIATPYRSGGVVGFQVELRQAIGARVVPEADSTAENLELGELRVRVPNSADLVTIVGRGGEIYLEGLGVGTYEGTVTLRGAGCSLVLVVPDALDPYVDLGDLVCAASATSGSVDEGL